MAKHIAGKHVSNSTMALRDDIVAMAGYWEPISFITRGGRAYRGINDDKFPYSPEMAQHMHGIGINLVVWHYYKGLGIKTEEEEMKRTATFFKHCEKAGIARGVYINHGSVFADTFFVENPQARKWVALDQFGQPHQYSEFYRCYYRYRPCCSNKEYGDYIAKAAVKSIKEAGADLILFDNSAQMSCYCENCAKKFPEYVLKKFPIKAKKGQLSFKERFGYDYKGSFVLPRGTARMPIDTLPAAHEPGLYEWVRYRQDLYESTMRNTVGQIREADPDARISWNIALDFGEFPGLVWGLDAETAYRVGTDFFFSEDENYAGIEDNELISHIRTYKYGYTMKHRVFTHNTINTNDRQRFLNYAEAAAFNRGCLGRVMWATESDNGKFDILRKALKFFRTNKEVYLNSKPVSSIALYRCAESETLNWAYSGLSRLAIEQVMIKNSIQYDTIINDTFDDVHKYKLLICPNTVAVSDAIAEKMAEFIRRGGKMLLTEASLNKDEYGRKRLSATDMGLVGERDANLGKAAVTAETSKLLQLLGLEKKYIPQIFYIGTITVAREFVWNLRLAEIPVVGKEYQREPLNKDEVLANIRKAVPDQETIVDGPDNVIAGYFETQNGRRVVHLFDYEASGRELEGVRLQVRLPKGIISKATFVTLEESMPVKLDVQGDYASCVLPAFATYGYLLIEFN